jgi:hypothetical protein
MKSVPAWVKKKGFSNWGDYMASIRPAQGVKRKRLKKNPTDTEGYSKSKKGRIQKIADAFYHAEVKNIDPYRATDGMTTNLDELRIGRALGKKLFDEAYYLKENPRKRKRLSYCKGCGGQTKEPSGICLKCQTEGVGRKNPESVYDEAVNILEKHLREYIAKAKRQGTVGMSKANLKQVVSTRGLRIPASAFDRAFNDAVSRLGNVHGFEIISSNHKSNPSTGKLLPMVITEIRYKRSGGEYHNELFKHHFKTKPKAYGLPDGSILLKQQGKRLWGTT